MTNTIYNAYNYLKKFKEVKKPIINNNDILPLESLIQEKNYYSTDIPRILFVGEFKAGKSTLLNALFKGNYAATDILEMTSWVARYWPSDDEFCKITYKDGKEEFTKPKDFKDKCQNRDYTEKELSNIERVDIGVKDSDIKYSIIDSPGFGSTTVKNEKRVIDAISEADFVFWILSCEVIGGMREAAIVNKIKEKETPMICVLTKCDLIGSEDELNDVIEYINETYDIETESVFHVSAKDYINSPSEYETRRFNNLVKFINEKITVNKVDIRLKAQESHLKRIAEHCEDLLESIEVEVDNVIVARERYRSLLTNVRMSVANELESDIVKYVIDNLFKPHRESIIDNFNNIDGKFTSEKINESLQKSLPHDYMDKFWNKMLNYMLMRIKKLWSEGIENNVEELKKINDIVMSTKFSVSFSNDVEKLKKMTNIAADETFKTSIQASIGIAGVATAYAALIGPAAAYVTLGAAATGIGLPIALMGAGVSAAVYFFKSKNGSSKKIDGEKILKLSIDQFIDGVVRTELISKAKELNAETEEVLINKFEKQIYERLPDENLDKINYEIKNLKAELEKLNLGGSSNESIKECPFCGKKITNNTAYCLNCGSSLKGA